MAPRNVPTTSPCIASPGRRQIATGNIPVGAPLPNTQLYVLDANLQPLPVGVTGELCIGGAGVGRGYINDPAQSRQRFLPDPFSRRTGSRLYRTGDLARRRADGTIECLGRADHQVKIRGYRIELKEIENALAGHPDVRAGLVEARREASGDVRLIAHIVATARQHEQRQRAARIPEEPIAGHAIPSAFLFLDQVPLNAHGKLDRSALLAPALEEVSGPDAAVPARRFTEKVLSDIWIDLLKVESIGVTDNFFDLGGHSLLAGQTMARIARALGVSLPIKTIFEAPTIEELARQVDAAVATKPRKPGASGPKAGRTRPRRWRTSAALDRAGPDAADRAEPAGSAAVQPALRLQPPGPARSARPGAGDR